MTFKAVLADPDTVTGKQTQFYEMLGTRGIWHQGWFAKTVHAATPSGWGHFDADRWELYHIERDRSQSHDLAAEHPDKLEELKALWFAEADKYDGLPLAGLNIPTPFRSASTSSACATGAAARWRAVTRRSEKRRCTSHPYRLPVRGRRGAATLCGYTATG
jgi:hypothetical protein